MLTYILSVVGVIVVVGIFTVWLVHEINKKINDHINKKSLHSH